MAREDQKPSAEVAAIAERSIEEMRSTCSDTVALVLATDAEKTPLIVQSDDSRAQPVVCEMGASGVPVVRPLQLFEGEPVLSHVIRELSRAQVSSIYVLCIPELSQEVRSVAYGIRRRRNDPEVHVFEVDLSAMLERTRAAGDIEVFGVWYAVLEIARALAGEGLGRCDSVLIMRADQPRIVGEHVYELCDDLRKRPGTDVVASQIRRLRQPPYLFATDFLDRLCEQASNRLATSTGIGAGMLGCGAQVVNVSGQDNNILGEAGAREAECESTLHMSCWDHVFKERKLVSNDAVSE